MNNYGIRVHNETHTGEDNSQCLLCTTKCGEGHQIEGHQIRIAGLDGYFTMTYAGWGVGDDSQWLVNGEGAEYMLRCTLDEAYGYLIEPERDTSFLSSGALPSGMDSTRR